MARKGDVLGLDSIGIYLGFILGLGVDLGFLD